MPATKTHPAYTARYDGVWLPVWLDKMLVHKQNFTNKWLTSENKLGARKKKTTTKKKKKRTKTNKKKKIPLHYWALQALSFCCIHHLALCPGIASQDLDRRGDNRTLNKISNQYEENQRCQKHGIVLSFLFLSFSGVFLYRSILSLFCFLYYFDVIVLEGLTFNSVNADAPINALQTIRRLLC